jgi:hypothetical protein
MSEVFSEVVCEVYQDHVLWWALLAMAFNLLVMSPRLRTHFERRNPVSVSGPEIQTSPFYWAHLSRFHMKTVSETSCFLIEDRTMDTLQNCDSYINIPSLQTYR